MADIVEEEVELHLIDTRELVKEARKLKEAQKLADQAKKVKKQLTSSSSPIPFAGDIDTLPKAEAKKQTRVSAITGQKTTSAFTDLQKKVKSLDTKQKKIKKLTDEVQDKILDKLDLAGNVLSADVPALLSSGLGRFGPIGALVASAIAPILTLFLKQFERGGVFSTKLKVTEQEKNINDIDFVVDVRSGTKFLTSDLRIAQTAPDTSNTLNLKYEHIRYVSQELGV